MVVSEKSTVHVTCYYFNHIVSPLIHSPDTGASPISDSVLFYKFFLQLRIILNTLKKFVFLLLNQNSV